jgi:hypothetical protein
VFYLAHEIMNCTHCNKFDVSSQHSKRMTDILHVPSAALLLLHLAASCSMRSSSSCGW